MRTRFAAFLLALAAPVAAQAPAAATLFTRVEDGVVRAAIEIELEPGWHIYHGPTKADLGHPKAIGAPTEVELSGEGIEWSVVRFPEPHVFDQSDFGEGIFINGHEDYLVLYAAGRLTDGGGDGAVVSAKLKGLVCQESCIPYNETVKTKGAGADSLFADFPADLVSSVSVSEPEPEPEPEPDAPVARKRSDELVRGENADTTLYSRVVDGELQVAFEIEVTDSWHIYHGPTKAELGHKPIGKPTRIKIEGVTLDRVVFPEPHRYDQSDISGEGAYINGHEGTIVVYARGAIDGGLAEVTGTIEGQTCDPNLCIDYEELVVSRGEGPAAIWAGWDAAMSAPPDSGDGEEGDAEKSLWAFILLAIGGGLFALVMPCTYPMIPITISFFTKQAESRGGNVLPLSLAYGAGIILIFIVIGVVFGSLIIPFATHPVTNLVIGLAFLYFALVLFGWVQLNPPRFLMSAAGKASMKGGVVGVFLMGATLVVTSFTCTAPFVGTLLSVGAADGDLGRIALGMAVFGLTMAVPFVFLSLVPGRIQAMPRSGEWMNTLKHFLGFVEVAAALKFISNSDIVWNWFFLSREVFLFLWALIFLVAAIYLFGAFQPRNLFRVGTKRIVGGTLSVFFAAYCAWGMVGNKLDFVMTAIAPNYSGGIIGPQWYAAGGEWIIVKDDYEGALEQARSEGKLLFVNFTGFT